MSTVAKALCAILQTEGVGTFNTDIFVGLRETPKSGVFLTEYDAQEGDLQSSSLLTEDEKKFIQVVVRGVSTPTVEAKARAARVALSFVKKTQGSLCLYDCISLQPPVLMQPSKTDDRNLVNMIFNVELCLERY